MRAAPYPHPGVVLQMERIAARRIAVAESHKRYRALRRVHRTIAADLAALDPERASPIIARALQMVQRWERHSVPSPYYAKAWRRILEDPASRIPKMLRGKNANALVQSSPFGFLFRRARYRRLLAQ
ncbi:hypothetical protein X12_004515 (plasmid) [Xanthomonas arboricola]|uniref:hypothetical protein n=1 Tax=Xanthomonas arboricola TaxID=56448 RepID=UPI002B312B73|nr:hypothetical protein X12_004515 [Xanthomonas arboricola]